MTMRIKRFTETGTRRVVGYVMWLSARDTYNWAHKPQRAWPCSAVSNRAIVVSVDDNGIYDISGVKEVIGDELEAIVGDHLPADCRHLWPTWEPKPVAATSEFV
jgi:hypothetical protein